MISKTRRTSTTQENNWIAAFGGSRSGPGGIGDCIIERAAARLIAGKPGTGKTGYKLSKNAAVRLGEFFQCEARRNYWRR
jgi:hypothetical protein